MAFETGTFNLFTDSNCTIAVGSAIILSENTDLSDNPTDKLYYLGSVEVLNQLQATSDPGVDQITLSVVDSLPEWEVLTAYIVGDRVQATGGGDGFVYKCTDPGTSHATTEPVWAGMGGLGSTIADSGVIWTKISAKHEITEVTLALSGGDLDTNVPGDPLDIGDTVLGGDDNAVPIYIRFINAVTNVANNTGHPEISLSINEVIESAIP